nr:hypothetical protein [Bacteroidota bacterium]
MACSKGYDFVGFTLELFIFIRYHVPGGLRVAVETRKYGDGQKICLSVFIAIVQASHTSLLKYDGNPWSSIIGWLPFQD